MTTSPLLAPTDSDRAHDEVVHYWCCDPNVAWCGHDLTGERDCPDDCSCQPCVVCEDLDDQDCPTCGERFYA